VHATLTFIHSIMDLSDQISSSMAEMDNDSDDDGSSGSGISRGNQNIEGVAFHSTSSSSSTAAVTSKAEARKRAAAVGALWNTVVALLTDAEALPRHAAGLPQLWQERAVLGPQRTHQKLMAAGAAYRAALHGLVERRAALAAAYSDLVAAVQTHCAPATGPLEASPQPGSSSSEAETTSPAAPEVHPKGSGVVMAAAAMAPPDDHALVKNESISTNRTPIPPQRDMQHASSTSQSASAPREPAPPSGLPPRVASSPSSSSQSGAADDVPKVRKAREKGEKKTKERSEKRSEKVSMSSKLLPPPPEAPPVLPPPAGPQPP